MAGKNKKKKPTDGRIAVQNRRARHDYMIEDTVEAGIVLTGTEVKSLRAGHASIGESFAVEREGELYLMNAHINEYEPANRFNHAPVRPRKLLLHKREMERLFLAQRRGGMTLVPLAIRFNPRGIAKVDLALARGKRSVDKRDTEKKRDWNREKQRLLREKG